MEQENQNYGQLGVVIDSRCFKDSFNVITTDNRVDNRVDNSVNYTSTTIYNTPAKDEEVFEWLSAISFGNKHSDILNQREAGTGQWFLEHASFKQWLHGESRVLICEGIPGAGKSTLASIAINHLETSRIPGAAIAYIYCNYKAQAQHTAANLMSSVLWQVAMASGQAFHALRELYQKHQPKSTKLERSECLQALKDSIRGFSQVFIFIDALDEMAERERDKFLKEMKILVEEAQAVQLLITSRPMEYLAHYFQGTASARVELRAKDTDLATYLHAQIAENSDLREIIQGDHRLQEHITEVITQKAKGMFLLARLHLEKISTAITIDALRQTLQNLPQEIEDTYGDIMERIMSQGAVKEELAKAVLVWITCTLRPIELSELQHALAVTIVRDNMRLSDASLILPNRILSACCGLVVVDEKSTITRLVHYSAHDYLSHRMSKLLNPAPDATLATACMRYLFLDTNFFTSARIDENQYHFLRYAAHYWGHHARKALQVVQSTVFEQQVTNFLKNLEILLEQKDVKLFWSRFIGWEGIDLDAPPGLVASMFGLYKMVHEIIQEPSCGLSEWWGDAVYYAVREGYEDVLGLLVEKAAELRRVRSVQRALNEVARKNREGIAKLLFAKDASANTAHSREISLYTAVESGHEGMAKLLLEMGADANVRCRLNTVLYVAAEGGHTGIVEVLLEHGVDVRAECDQYRRNPLYAAVVAGYERIVNLLLGKGADANAKCGYGEKPMLLVATDAGHEAIVYTLLDHGADPNTTHDQKTALYTAAKSGHESIVMLLEKGADVDVICEGLSPDEEEMVNLLLARDPNVYVKNDRKTALYAAVEAGHEAIVKLLLQHNADPNTMCGRNTALSIAVQAGHQGVVKLLLERSNALDNNDKNKALSTAIQAGHDSIVKTLLEAGADVKGSSALYTAILSGHEGIVNLLLQKGAALDQCDRGMALEMAVEDAHEGIVKALLMHGVDPNAETHKPVLYTAVEAGNERIASLLLEHGANAEMTCDWYNGTVLYKAVEGGHEGIVRLLLEKGADARTVHQSQTALYTALQAGYGGIVNLLIEHGADAARALDKASQAGDEGIAKLLLELGVNPNSECDQKPVLYTAAQAGQEGVVKLLLEHGADVNAKHDERTALYAAVESGHDRIVKLLLEKGASIEPTASKGTCLYSAAVQGHTSVVRVMLQHGISLAVHGGTILCLAARHGGRRLVCFLLEQGAPVNTPVVGKLFDELACETHTPLSSAIYGGHVGIVEILLEYGANVEAGNEKIPRASEAIQELLLAHRAVNSKQGRVETEAVEQEIVVQNTLIGTDIGVAGESVKIHDDSMRRALIGLMSSFLLLVLYSICW